MIKTIFLFPNGILAVCDEHGQQLPEFQQHYSEVVERLRGQDLTGADIYVSESFLEGGSAGEVTPNVFLHLEQEVGPSGAGDDGANYLRGGIAQ